MHRHRCCCMGSRMSRGTLHTSPNSDVPFPTRHRSRGVVVTLLSLIGASMGGCHSGPEVRSGQLLPLATFQNTGSAEITTVSGKKVVVAANRSPQLALHGAYESVVQNGIRVGPSDLIVQAPLERFRFEPSHVILLAEGPPGEAGPGGLRYRGPEGGYDVPITAIRSGEIVLGPPLEEPWEPRWGLGASIAGPSRLVSVNFELRVGRHFATEVGLLLVGPAGTFWTGAKVISPRVHRIAFFAGGFAGMILEGEGSMGAGSVAFYGVRFGIELMLRSWADALSLEVDFLRQRSDPPDQGSFEGCRDGSICPFGGASYVHFF